MAIKLLLGGGLGNQLFQYAALRAHTLRIKTDLRIDIRYYDPHNSSFDKKSWLQSFPIKSEVVSYASKQKAHNMQARLIRRFITEPPKLRYQSKTFGFDRELQNIPDNFIVSGLFQSPQHFEKEWGDIESELDLLKSGTIPQQAEYNGIPLSECVAVHIRRGDYLATPGFAMSDSVRYYSEAMAEVGVKDKKILLFSDDQEWCSRQEIFNGAEFFKDIDRPPHFALFTMAQCGAVIIANSTFSWWGGWFAHKRGSKIIAPKMWILGKNSQDLNLIPNEWSLI